MADVGKRDEFSYFEYYASHVIDSAFDDYKSTECKRLRKIVFKCDTTEDQFKLIFDNPLLAKPLENVKNELIFATKKSVKAAIQKLKAGHSAFDAEEYEEALVFYTESILLLPFPKSPTSADELWAQCFLHRALTYFRLQMYKASVTDFDQAINHTADNRQKVFLIVFKAYALQLLKLNDDSNDTELDFQLTSTNEHMRCTISEVDIVKHPQKGRTIITKQELKTGKLLIVEPAVVAWLRPSFYDAYCNHCLQKLNKRCFPCQSCSDVRYCSWKCSETAWKSYHSVECKFGPTLKFMVFGTLGLRLMIMYGIDNVINYFQKKEQHDSVANGKLDANLETMMSLVGEMQIPDHKFEFEVIIGVAVVTKIAECMGLIKESSPFLLRFAATLKRCVMKVLLNCFYTYDEQLKKSNGFVIADYEFEEVGFCVYASASMFSHSCNCNANRSFNGSTIYVYANREIGENSEVTVDYGTDIFHNAYEYRRAFLISSFGFKCGCESCLIVTDNVPFALRCPQCDGPVIMNYTSKKDKSNRCISCGDINLKMKPSEKILDSGDSYYRKAERRIDKEEWSEAKSYLKKCIARYSEVYYSKVPLRHAHEMLCLCYENMSRYSRAFD
ncbi:SET and MYND domain-containing protein 4-like protein, partial [Leptotrombidium deliense]